MLNREDWIMIREMRKKGCYLREIAAQVGCSERTVCRALKRGGPPPRRRPSKLDPFKPLIDQLLSEEVWNAEVIYAEIRARGYGGGRSILRDYIRPKRVLRKARGTVRFETAPGRQLQSDWGQIDTVIADQATRVHFAVNLGSVQNLSHFPFGGVPIRVHATWVSDVLRSRSKSILR